MATRLPTREECENWRMRELAEFLRLNNLYDPATVVERQRISGAMFLNSSDILQNRFSVIDYLQIQKIVHDIKKNDSGIIGKFKKFQNEQVALMCKTGKNTWDRFTKHAPPTVPQRDYSEGAEGPEGGRWSDNEFDNSDYENPDGHSDGSDTYEDPRDDGEDDENYEPPPSEIKSNKIIPQSFNTSKGEYADNRPVNRPAMPFSKPPPMLPRSSPIPTNRKMPPQPQAPGKMEEDDENDYIVPVENNEPTGACIDPTEKSAPPAVSKPPMVNRAAKPSGKPSGLSSSPKTGYFHGPGQAAIPAQLHTESPQDHDVYEVPDTEEASPPVHRAKPQLPKPGAMGTGSPILNPRSFPNMTALGVPRNESPVNRKAPISKPEADDDEYEVCDPEPSISTSSLQDPRTFALPAIPIAAQRELKPAIRPLPKPRMGEPPREQSLPEGEKPRLPDRPRLSNPTAEVPVLPAPRFGPKPAVLRLPIANQPNLPTRPNGITVRPGVPTHSASPNLNSSTEQDPSVDGKVWFAAHCDRKTAEEALNKLNKDGSFLIRKSSGQDSKQPYTLVVLYKRRVYNIPVRHIELTEEYALGKEKIGEERFASVADIIENHQKNPLVLIDSQNNTKDSTKLKYPVKIS